MTTQRANDQRFFRTSRASRWTSVLGAAALLAVAASPAQALDTDYPPDGDNPLRIVWYLVAPVGTFLEWTVTRPMAAVGSVVSPFPGDEKETFRGCSRERPARSCTNVVSR